MTHARIPFCLAAIAASALFTASAAYAVTQGANLPSGGGNLSTSNSSGGVATGGTLSGGSGGSTSSGGSQTGGFMPPLVNGSGATSSSSGGTHVAAGGGKGHPRPKGYCDNPRVKCIFRYHMRGYKHNRSWTVVR